MRDDFSAQVKDELAKRVGYLCSNPGCRQPTSGPKSSPVGTVNIGVAAHLAAASPGGPRYDSSLSAEHRCSSDNGIWLCQTCAKLIDSDLSRYTVEKLREWKADAEAASARALEHRRAPATQSEGVFLEAERLMPDLIAEMRGDVRHDHTELVREFVRLTSRGVQFGGKARFRYFEPEHPQLVLQMDRLEEMGLIVLVTANSDWAIYRMLPEFVGWLRSSPNQPLHRIADAAGEG